MNRRKFVKNTGFLIASVSAIPPVLQGCMDHSDIEMSSNGVLVREGAFNTPLTFPDVVSGNVSMVAKANNATLVGNSPSSVLGYGEGILGPTIKVDNGADVNINFRNQLSEVTNIHWHGLLVPENMDGHPKDLIQSGDTYNYTFPIAQRAGTNWYHPHPHGRTASQVFNGLAGFFIINDQEERALDLPSGEQELLLVIQDKRFNNGQLNYSPSMMDTMTGYLGEHILVNGKSAPFYDAADRHYRLRLLNGSTARVFNIAFSDNHSFIVIGTDGGLLPQPVTVNSLLLGPGERADILVNFKGLTPRKEIYLTSNSFNGGIQGQQAFKIMKFVISRQENDSFVLPGQLPSITPIPIDSEVKTRQFVIQGAMSGPHGNMGTGMHTINNKVFDMNRIDETVNAGSTEIWEFDNSGGDEIHPMHIHGVQFQVISRNGGRNSLIPTEKGWKDTVLVMPKEKVRVIMTFPQEKGVFVFHCHNLEHEDDGMMLNFQIV